MAVSPIPGSSQPILRPVTAATPGTPATASTPETRKSGLDGFTPDPDLVIVSPIPYVQFNKLSHKYKHYKICIICHNRTCHVCWREEEGGSHKCGNCKKR